MTANSVKYMFFTGKGGVGKTSLACATAIGLADSGKTVLLVCTDPASNLQDVLGTRVSDKIMPVQGVARLFAVNILPEAAAEAYRKRVTTPLEGMLTSEEIAGIQENLSGACTTEVASFDEFSRFISGEADGQGADIILFDTAPTGHTLRLLSLPAAWSGFTAEHPDGASCLGPASALKNSHDRYTKVLNRLQDAEVTTFYIVSRPDKSALKEAARTSSEMAALGLRNQVLYINGVFKAMDKSDRFAAYIENAAEKQLEQMPAQLKNLPSREFPLLPYNVLGIDRLRSMFDSELQHNIAKNNAITEQPEIHLESLARLADGLSAQKESGLVMTMGKGGVGKTLVATTIAVLLASKGLDVLLTTTDPAAHIRDFTSQLASLPGTLSIEQIDPKAETQRYIAKIIETKGKGLDDEGKKLLLEDLQSPCTEEVAVFHAFSRAISQSRRRFVVIDTAPTGHTLLLLDTAGSYHREVMRHNAHAGKVRTPLMSLQDETNCHIILVSLPETTPMREAASLQDDLARAGIKPFAWVINQSLSLVQEITDPVLKSRALAEIDVIHSIESDLAARVFGIPYMTEEPLLPALLASLQGK